jgi:RNA polymerase sigma factor (sigma-70 family)
MELALSSTETAVPRNDQALVQAARGGDDRAFERLYAMYRDRVGAFIFNKVHDHGRAEDISQEVFMSALRQLRSNEREIAFKPWVFAIAKNACIDEFRRSARGREVPVEAGEDFPNGQRASLSIVPSPPSAIESKQRLADLRGAFGGLSESHHRMLVMRELEGRSYDEIGDRLGMTRQMVESGLFRARRKLSEEYDELASGRRCEQVQTVIDSGAALKLKALGIKERRRLTQHLSHCQSCRHQARMAGVDPSLLKPRSIAAKIAALLPFGGFWRWPWRGGGSSAARAHASSHVAGSGAAQAAGTTGSSITLGQAAAAAAALAIAGAGGGIAIAQHDHQGHRPPPITHDVSTTSHAGSGTGARLAPGVVPGSGHAVGAQGAGAARSNAQGARAAAKRSAVGTTTLGSGAKQRTTTTSPTSGQSHTTPTAGSGTSTPGPGTQNQNPISSSGNQGKNLLNSTINRTGGTVGKVTAPVKKVVAPVTKAVDPVVAPVKKVVAPVTKAVDPVVKKVVAPVTKAVDPVVAPVQKAVDPVVAPVKKVVAPVTKAVDPVVAPVKKVVAPVTEAVLPTSGPASTGTSGSGGSPGSSGLPDPVDTVKKIIPGL